jgi:hypothetical protein
MSFPEDQYHPAWITIRRPNPMNFRVTSQEPDTTGRKIKQNLNPTEEYDTLYHRSHTCTSMELVQIWTSKYMKRPENTHHSK